MGRDEMRTADCGMRNEVKRILEFQVYYGSGALRSYIPQSAIRISFNSTPE
jgi:hypothetical protein